jgi:hypothetical protein
MQQKPLEKRRIPRYFSDPVESCRTGTILYWNFTAHFHWMELGVWREKWAVHFYCFHTYHAQRYQEGKS